MAIKETNFTIDLTREDKYPVVKFRLNDNKVQKITFRLTNNGREIDLEREIGDQFKPVFECIFRDKTFKRDEDNWEIKRDGKLYTFTYYLTNEVINKSGIACYYFALETPEGLRISTPTLKMVIDCDFKEDGKPSDNYVSEFEKLLKEAEKVKQTIKDLNQILQEVLEGGGSITEVILARKDADGVVHNTLKERLDKEREKVTKLIQREVHVDDFGGKADGYTDSTRAFEAAIGDGNVKVHMSEGTYIVRGVKAKNFTNLVGKGKGVTILKLHEDATSDAFVVSNDDIKSGNKYIKVSDMTLDGNVKRQGGLQPPGGSRGSCLSIHASMFVYVERVEAKNAVLHGIDVTCSGLDYPYDGDGTWGAGPSKYIWIKDCETYNFGDDGITTHHSEYIWIEDCYSHDPRNRGNQNGIEIDDGSRHVFLKDNHTERCYGGVEVKAHESASAPYDVVINGHRSVGDVRSYNFRHIGHHTESDPDTLTAKGITASNLVSIRPNNKLGFQDGAKPRALAISAYQGVNINGFSAFGDPASTEFIDQPVVAMQYKVRNITLNVVNIQGFGTAKQDIYVIGSKNKADNITISSVNLLD
ncbi:glycosyl hydrolase family 28-related protein, partial [Bacillus tropicus]|uniref:glycosyl hydrolase family 28-related protein n=1 Tax=Bacillus tropicus TaxID=2026188 RepID=UPI003D255B86